MKLCVAQTDIVWQNKTENMSHCRSMICSAAEQGAELIVFPELSLTGFSMNADLSEESDGETVRFFEQCSREYGTAVVFGYACRVAERIFNRLCVADNGAVIAEYDKLHPFSYGGENSVYSAGDKLVSARVRGIELGLTVCYDLRFPEIYQKLSDSCSLIVVSANWPDSRRKHWSTLLRARAIETQTYIAGCNRCGKGDGLNYSGDSAVISPNGDAIASAEMYEQQLIYAEIDAGVCSAARKDFPVRNDRRQQLYRDFYVG